MPLNYNGHLVDQFSMTFENGRIVDFHAEVGYEVLKSIIETDEGSHYLGEVALVPYNSPIRNMGILFYNTSAAWRQRREDREKPLQGISLKCQI